MKIINFIIILFSLIINTLFKYKLILLLIPINKHINKDKLNILKLKIFGYNNKEILNKYNKDYQIGLILNILLLIISIINKNIFLSILNIILILIIIITIYISITKDLQKNIKIFQKKND